MARKSSKASPKLPGIYIVTLNNIEPISVNAQDPRIADKCIKVDMRHCKIGKAKDLATRKRNYEKTFGPHNVNFVPLISIAEIDGAERIILSRLDSFRIRGKTGRRNEWLEGISADEAVCIVRSAIADLGFSTALSHLNR